MDRHQKIDWITMSVIVGFTTLLLSTLIHTYSERNATLFYFLFSGQPPLFIFRDFEHVYSVLIDHCPYQFTNPAYFPFIYVYASIFNLLNLNISLFAYLVLILILLIFYTYKNIGVGVYQTDIKNTFIFVFLSYPGFFSIQRLNHDAVIMLITTVFIHFYYYRKWWIAPFILSTVIAMKGYPAAFLVLFFVDRRYKEIVLSILSTLVLTCLSYQLLRGGFIQNIQGNLAALNFYTHAYALGEAGLGYGHTLYGFMKVLIAIFSPDIYRSLVPILFHAMTYVSFIIFGIITVYIFLIEKIFWKKVALVVFSICLLPHVSADYKLLFVFIPLFLFINTENTNPTDYLYIIIFSLLLIPTGLHYYTFNPATGIPPYYINTSVLIEPIIILMGIMSIMGEGIWTQYFSPNRI